MEFKEFSVALVKMENVSKKDKIIKRTIKLTNKTSNQQQEIIQLQYTEWPDRKAPDSSRVFRKLVHTVDNARKTGEPILIHCR